MGYNDPGNLHAGMYVSGGAPLGGILYSPYKYNDPGRFDRMADRRSVQDTSYAPMFLSGGIQRDMGIQGAISRPYGGYEHFQGGFGSATPVGNAFHGYGGAIQGRMAMPTEQVGPWSGFNGMTNYGSSPEGYVDVGARQVWGQNGSMRVRRGGIGGFFDRYKSVPTYGWING